MNSSIQKIKKLGIVFLVFACIAFVSYRCETPVCAYTREEIDAAKAWLSANGYSPDAGGAYAAYEDYMNGRFGAIPGLPEPNVKDEVSDPQQEEVQPPAEQPVPDTEESKTDEEIGITTQEPEGDNKEPPEEDPKKKSKESQKDDGDSEEPEVNLPGGDPAVSQQPESQQETTQQPLAEESATEKADKQSVTDGESGEVTEFVLPNTSQQEFAAMIDVFASEFSQSEQEEINKAKERLEKQKQERMAAEKESENIVQQDKKPQKKVILLLGAILFMAVIGLGIILVKKNHK